MPRKAVYECLNSVNVPLINCAEHAGLTVCKRGELRKTQKHGWQKIRIEEVAGGRVC